MDVAQMPGWATYSFGVVWLDEEGCSEVLGWCGERKRETNGRVEGREAVMTRMSVNRLEDSYATGEDRPWRSAAEKHRS